MEKVTDNLLESSKHSTLLKIKPEDSEVATAIIRIWREHMLPCSALPWWEEKTLTILSTAMQCGTG